MTEPRRHTADSITDDELDRLYARIATLEAVAAGNKRHVQLIVPDLEAAVARAERAEAETARWRRGHETAEAQLHHGRRQLAELEAITARVRAECDRIEAAVRDNPTSPDLTGGYLACLRHIRAALDPQETRP